MLSLALTALAAGASAGAVLALRLRRNRRGAAMERATPLPAGIQHLAATLSDLSGGGLDLRAVTSRARKPRLGTLLGLR